MTDDRAAVHALVTRAQQAQSDPSALLPLHHPDAVVVNIAGRRVLGRDALGEAMAAALASPLADVRTTVDVADVRFVRPDIALVSCVKHVHDGRDGGEALPLRGALSYVLERTDGAWRIALAQTTPIPG